MVSVISPAKMRLLSVHCYLEIYSYSTLLELAIYLMRGYCLAHLKGVGVASVPDVYDIRAQAWAAHAQLKRARNGKRGKSGTKASVGALMNTNHTTTGSYSYAIIIIQRRM